MQSARGAPSNRRRAYIDSPPVEMSENAENSLLSLHRIGGNGLVIDGGFMKYATGRNKVYTRDNLRSFD